MMPDGPSVASPCIGVCTIDDDSRLCQGCWRSIDEIVDWREASDDERRAILNRIQQRKARSNTLTS